MKTIALVLAGGKGNRFWPKSSPQLPKQFLALEDSKTLLQKTVERLLKLVGLDDIYIVAPEQYQELIRMQLPELNNRNIIIEPQARDTAVAIGYASLVISERLKCDPVMVVVPSDHLVKDEERWVSTLKQAAQFAELAEVVTVGISPTRLETGYGYIILGQSIPGQSIPGYFVKKFIEKPEKSVAKSLIEAGNCLWNSGMFIWKLSTFWACLEKYFPDLFIVLEKIKNLWQKTGSQGIDSNMLELFSIVPAISIDFGVVEKCQKIIALKGDFYWDDMGDWRALERNGLSQKENILNYDSSGCIVDWSQGPAVVIGADNLVVSGSDEGLLVCTKDKLPRLKKILNSPDFLEIEKKIEKERKNTDQKSGTVIDKPWGKEIVWAHTKNYVAKILVVFPGEATSVHLHQEKEETFYVQSGTGYIMLKDEVIPIKPGQVIHVEPRVPHRIIATSEVRLVEVSTNHLDDVIRLMDKYGREGKRKEDR